MYVINNRSDSSQWWSNEFGWVDLDSADLFSIDEQRHLHLPMDGYWVPLWSVDVIQFARFIVECNAAGVFNQDRLLEVCESMDLEYDQLLSLIERAEIRWEEQKEKLM